MRMLLMTCQSTYPLKGTTHYDNGDKTVFKVADVTAEDFNYGKGVVAVVYHSKLKERKGKVNGEK